MARRHTQFVGFLNRLALIEAHLTCEWRCIPTALDPLKSFDFALLIPRHLQVGGFHVRRHDVWPREFFQVATDSVLANVPDQPLVHVIGDGDPQSLAHAPTVDRIGRVRGSKGVEG